MGDLDSSKLNDLLGSCIGFFDPMHGGKTEALIRELKHAVYYGANSVAYNSSLNTREDNAIVVSGEADKKTSFPAKTVSSIDELQEDLKKKILFHRSYTPSRERLGQKIDVDGIPQRIGYPLRVVGVDEANLFTLTPENAQKMIKFLDWTRQENLAVFLAGLKYDFRHLPFGYIHAVLPYVNLQYAKKPACKTFKETVKEKKIIYCGNLANHTQRVWSREFAQEQGLEKYLAAEPALTFVDKDETHFFDKYVPAPFFDKTLRIEETKDGRVKYLPVCNNCARVPFKEETFEVYRALVRGEKTFGFLGQPELTAAILSFLEEERWATRDADSQLTPVPFYFHPAGGYSPVG